MKYRSKKNPEIEASLDFEDEKYRTAMMIYLTGPDAGKSFSITTATLKRWWEPINTVDSILKLDSERINTPYNPNVKPHYIPKPQSVIDYENKKNTRYNASLPSFDVIVDDLGSKACKVNKNSEYLKFNDKSTLWRKRSKIDIYASEDLWLKLSEVGLQSSANKDKERPFAFKIETESDYYKVLEAFENV